jgi:hypothetical protein
LCKTLALFHKVYIIAFVGNEASNKPGNAMLDKITQSRETLGAVLSAAMASFEPATLEQLRAAKQAGREAFNAGAPFSNDAMGDDGELSEAWADGYSEAENGIQAPHLAHVIQEGYRAYDEGLSLFDNHYVAGTPECDAWNKGFHIAGE